MSRDPTAFGLPVFPSFDRELHISHSFVKWHNANGNAAASCIGARARPPRGKSHKTWRTQRCLLIGFRRRYARRSRGTVWFCTAGLHKYFKTTKDTTKIQFTVESNHAQTSDLCIATFGDVLCVRDYVNLLNSTNCVTHTHTHAHIYVCVYIYIYIYSSVVGWGNKYIGLSLT